MNWRRRLSRLLALALGPLMLSQPGFGEFFPGVGATGQSFLKLPMTARPAAMAGAFTAIDADAAAVEYNPAGISSVPRVDAQATYLGYLEETSLQAITGAMPLGTTRPDRAFVVGGQVRLFSSSEEGRDAVGKRTGDFDVRNQALNLTAALRRGPLSVGVAGAYVSEKIGSESRNNFLGNAGAQWVRSDRLTIGASVLNVGSEKAFISEKDPPPTTFRGGVAFRAKPRLLLSADGSLGRDKIFTKAVAAEFRFNRHVAFRAGALHHTDVEFAGGLGISFQGPEKKPYVAAPAIIPPPARREFEEQRPAPPRRSPGLERHRRLTLFAQSLTDQYKSLGMGLEKPALAVLPLTSDSPSIGMAISDRLAREFDRLEAFTLVDRAEMMRVLQEHNFQQTGAVTQQNALNMGRALGARFMMIGSVEKVEGRYLLNARLVDTERSAIVATAYESLDPGVLLEPEPDLPVEETPAQPAAPVAPRETRRAIPAPPPAPPPAFPNVDLGFDYAIRSQGDLGISHTVTLRLLY